MLGSIDLSQLLFEKDRCVRIHIVQPLQDFVTIGSEVAGGLQACVCYPCPLLARWKVSRDCVLMGIEGRPEVSTPLAPAQHAWIPHLQSVLETSETICGDNLVKKARGRQKHNTCCQAALHKGVTLTLGSNTKAGRRSCQHEHVRTVSGTKAGIRTCHAG